MNIRNFFGGFVEVANGLASILTLGYFAPGWDFRYHCWVTLHEHRRLKKRLGPLYPLVADENDRKEQEPKRAVTYVCPRIL